MEKHRTTVNDDRSFRRAPRREIVASVPRESLDALLVALAAAGYDSVEVLVDAAGLLVLDQLGHGHGFKGRLVRGLQQLGTEEANIEAYADALRAGRAVVGVAADPRDAHAAETFARYDAEHVVSYGRWSATEW